VNSSKSSDEQMRFVFTAADQPGGAGIADALPHGPRLDGGLHAHRWAINSDNRQLWRHLIRIFCGWAFLAAIVAAFAISGIRMDKISRDPAELADLPIYYGLLSNLGMLVWGAGAFISFFASFHVEGSEISSLLRWAGILTLILL
jgi:hypothetical protein